MSGRTAEEALFINPDAKTAALIRAGTAAAVAALLAWPSSSLRQFQVAGRWRPATGISSPGPAPGATCFPARRHPRVRAHGRAHRADRGLASCGAPLADRAGAVALRPRASIPAGGADLLGSISASSSCRPRVQMSSYGMITARSASDAAVVAEVYRAGVLAVPRGQSEAAASLSLSRLQPSSTSCFPRRSGTSCLRSCPARHRREDTTSATW
jgi:hypothetical protein